jgi:hypothetical protein
MRTARWRALCVAVAVISLLAEPELALAHQPDDAPYDNSWTPGQIDNGPSLYHFDGSVPSWLETPMNNLLQTNYANAAANNSDSIRFWYNSSGSATVLYKTRYASGVPADCSVKNWQGCANGAGSWSWNIWIRNEAAYTYCQHNPDNDPCRNIQRIAIHEAGHVSGFLAHNDVGDLTYDTVMNGSGAPLSGQDGGAVYTLLNCDEARMQMLYDLKDLNQRYADCFDHVNANAGPQGLHTVITATPSSSATCSGVPVRISGRLDIFDGHYGRRTGSGTTADPYKWNLDGNGLASRPVTIKRNGIAYATATAFPSAGNNWYYDFTLTSLTTITYNFTAQFVTSTADEPPPLQSGLDSSNLAQFSIQVIRDVDC